MTTALTVFGVYALCILASVMLVKRHGCLSETIRFRLIGLFTIISVAAFGSGIAFDLNWPIAVWYWVAGLMTGIPIGEFMLNRRNRLEAGNILA